MAHYSGKELANMLNGADAFFSDTPPPGAALSAVQGALPAPAAPAEAAAPVARFDMGGFNL